MAGRCWQHLSGLIMNDSLEEAKVLICDLRERMQLQAKMHESKLKDHFVEFCKLLKIEQEKCVELEAENAKLKELLDRNIYSSFEVSKIT